VNWDFFDEDAVRDFRSVVRCFVASGSPWMGGMVVVVGIEEGKRLSE